MEFDFVMGPGICTSFRQTWMEIVPFIISSARQMNSKTVKELLACQRFLFINDDYGKYSHCVYAKKTFN